MGGRGHVDDRVEVRKGRSEYVALEQLGALVKPVRSLAYCDAKGRPQLAFCLCNFFLHTYGYEAYVVRPKLTSQHFSTVGTQVLDCLAL